MNRTLVIGPSWLGDMVMAQSLFSTLKLQDEECEITVLAPAWCEPIIERMPQVADRITMPVGHGVLGLGARWKLSREIRRRSFQRAIVLPGSLKSALVPWLAGIPNRTGFVGEQRWGLLNDIRRLDKGAMPLNVQRYVSLGLEKMSALPDRISSPVLQVNKVKQQQAMEKFDLEIGKPVVAFCPGAEYGPAKQWPAKYFAALAKNLLDQERQVWIFGSEKDQESAAEILNLTDSRCINLVGLTSLEEVVDLIALASHVVTNDSGLMHVAAAVDCHVIAIYGSSSPAYTPPLTDKADIVSLELDCSPCFRRHCPLGHMNCLNQLLPEQILSLMDFSQ